MAKAKLNGGQNGKPFSVDISGRRPYIGTDLAEAQRRKDRVLVLWRRWPGIGWNEAMVEAADATHPHRHADRAYAPAAPPPQRRTWDRSMVHAAPVETKSAAGYVPGSQRLVSPSHVGVSRAGRAFGNWVSSSAGLYRRAGRGPTEPPAPKITRKPPQSKRWATGHSMRPTCRDAGGGRPVYVSPEKADAASMARRQSSRP